MGRSQADNGYISYDINDQLESQRLMSLHSILECGMLHLPLPPLTYRYEGKHVIQVGSEALRGGLLFNIATPSPYFNLAPRKQPEASLKTSIYLSTSTSRIPLKLHACREQHRQGNPIHRANPPWGCPLFPGQSPQSPPLCVHLAPLLPS
jgi:hypothetical protein